MPTALIVAEFGALNGGERSLLAMLPQLSEHGWRFGALVPPDSPFDARLQAFGIPTHPFLLFDQNGDRKSQTGIRDQIRDAIRQLKPNLVHSNSLAASRLAGPVCQALGVPGIGYLRDIVKLSRQAVADLDRNDALVAVSRATREFHIAQGAAADHVHVVYNGVDPEIFSFRVATGSLQHELAIPAASRCILFAGQIGLRKGLDTWLDAAEIIAREQPDCHFVIVGKRQSGKQESIEYETRLVKQSRCGVLAGRVHWLGERTDVARLMQESSILMHCANQEPLGRVLLEAFASGLPAVATNVGGTPEIFSGPVLSDLLCPLQEPVAVAAKTIELLKDYGLYQQVSARQREVAIRKFSVDRNSAALAKIYESLTQTTQ